MRLQNIRRGSRRAARALLPLLLGSWLAAAPCAATAMAAAVPGTPEHAAHEHGGCPHCPTGSQSGRQLSAALHGVCDETEGASYSRGTVIAKGDLKYAASGSSQTAACPSLRPSSPQDAVSHAGPPGTQVALHVRYCVYLI